MEFKLEFTKEAIKGLDKIPGKDRLKILAKIKEIPFKSNELDIIKMQGYETLFRLRVGNYRVIYEVYENLLIISVIDIGHRKDVYKNF